MLDRTGLHSGAVACLIHYTVVGILKLRTSVDSSTFFGRMKNEMYYGHEKDFSSFEEFSAAIDEYIDYYNNRRIQSKTKWMPPVKFRMTSICLA